MFGFYQYQCILWEQNEPTVVLCVHPGRNVSHLKKTPKDVRLEDIFEFVQRFYSAVFPFDFMPVIKIGPFLSSMRNSEYLHAPPA